MGTLRKIALAVLFVSFVVFVALFGRLPALRSTPIGFLYRVIWHYSPRILRDADIRLTGGRLTSSLSRASHYLLYEKHPIILIFFLALLTSASGVFLHVAWSRLPSFPHHIFIPLLLPLPYIFTYLCASSRASYITPATHAAQLRRYPYDHTLYHPGNICRTCTFAKPARSKHCSICRACIARADHHCVWVNNCLGASNYRWFVALLASLGAVLTYGAGLAILLLRRSPVFALPAGGRILAGGGIWAGLRAGFAKWTLAVQTDLEVGAVGLLAGLTAPLAWVLLAYHAYLAWAGMTTNETGKWADLREDMEDGLVWRRVDGEARRLANGEEPDVAWPVHSDQFFARTETPNDGPPSLSAPEDWERCWSLAESDNLYDIGTWHNLKDALYMR